MSLGSRFAVLLMSLLLLGGCLDSPAAQRSYDLVQQERSVLGLPPLVENNQLSNKAEAWSEYMAETGVLDHSPDLTSNLPSDWEVVGENVGVARSADRVHQLLMLSPPHRANVLGGWTRIGIGATVAEDGRIWITQVFLR